MRIRSRVRGRTVLGLGCVFFLLGLGSLAQGSKAAAAPIDSGPFFSLPGGVYTNNLKVELTVKEPGVTIRFTVDGSEPGTNSALYSAPISITNSALVRARAFRPNARPGVLVAEAYTLLGENVRDFRSNLPLVIINTFGQTLSQEAKIPVSVRFIRQGGQGGSLTGPADFNGRAVLNIRGHSSRQFPKHSYTLKLQDEAGNSRKAALLGLPADSDWVLCALPRQNLDPRAPGGAVAPEAKPYESAVPVPANAQVRARAHDGNKWSGPAVAE